MADITELLANAAKTDPKMWEAIGNIPKAYYEGQDQAYKQKMRNIFSDENGGLPRDQRRAPSIWEGLRALSRRAALLRSRPLAHWRTQASHRIASICTASRRDPEYG